MKKCENVQHKCKWPTSEDIDWVDFDKIDKKVDVSVATSKAGRMFAFSEDDLDLLNDGCYMCMMFNIVQLSFDCH